MDQEPGTLTDSELVLLGGPGDGELIPGVFSHGTYFRFRTDEERATLGDHLGDTYVLSREGGDLVGLWAGPETAGGDDTD